MNIFVQIIDESSQKIYLKLYINDKVDLSIE